MKQSKQEDLISVIVPVYNVERYIRKCLDSILGQTYSNIEVICVDDCSTDFSGRICDEYAEKHSRLKVIHKRENGGLSEARNTGMDFAKGVYISFIDSDDWVDQTFIECLYEGIKQNHADMAQCSYANVTNDCFPLHKDPLLDDNKVLTGKQALMELYSESSVYASVVYTVVWNKLYKRELVSGLKFPEGRMYEDQFFTYKCFQHAKKICVISEKLYCYRESGNSITRRGYSIHFQDEIVAHEEQIRYFKQKDFEFASVVIARIEPLCIMHYAISEFEDNDKAKRNAYRCSWKYLYAYLKNKKICFQNKVKLMGFLIHPDLFIQNKWDISFSVKDKRK
ncbi:MAG: glycosyltransferase [Lachnospiraceae bacterium]|jgi:glycosyltransferase involved in cell wall biosynthesis|nr:glycosyltransferase [Lachnospiraceae bacterium]